MQLLYSFGLGLAFAVGIYTGMFLCTIATKKGREEFRKDITDHNGRVEDRLAKNRTRGLHHGGKAV